MIPKPLENIEQVDLQNLIDGEVREGRTIDYKREISLDTGDEKREFLADVSSFANAAGGDLVIGMDEENGAPSAFPGLDLPDPDSEKLRIENLIRDGIAPRLPGMAIKLISLDGGRFVLVIRIGRSWVSPHRVIFRLHDKFYGRNSGGKYPMDVSELRTAFTLSETAAERIRNFRIERIARIKAYETPVPIEEGVMLVLHLVPLSGIMGGAVIDMNLHDETLRNFSPFSVSPAGIVYRTNIDGLVLMSGPFDGQPRRAYTQIYRNGVVEAVVQVAHVHQDGRIIIPLYKYEEELRERRLPLYLEHLRTMGFEPPIFVLLSFLGVRDTTLQIHPRHIDTEIDHSVDRDDLVLPEAVIEDFGANPAEILQPLIGMVKDAYNYG